MTQISRVLVSRLVLGHKQDGRCVYDPHVKAQIVQECSKPGVSVARVALQCGVNANLLRRWIGERVGVSSNFIAPARAAPAPGAAFVALQVQASSAHQDLAPGLPVMRLELRARLPNEVQLDISACGLAQLRALVELLGGLKCSSSTSP